MRLKPMRLIVLAAAAAVCAAPAWAQDEQSLNLPVSLERIREGLASDKPSLLDVVNLEANFRVEVKEQRPQFNFAEMFPPGSFDGGPVPPGGLYAYQQQQMLFPNSASALFTFNMLPVFRAITHAVGDARRVRAAAAARAEVERAMAEFCAAQPNRGEGIVGCGKPQ
jgi:hypothetical protein